MSPVSRRTFITASALAGGAVAVGNGLLEPAAASAAPTTAGAAKAAKVPNADRHAHFVDWATAAAFRAGTSSGVKITADGMTLNRSQGTITYADPFGDKTTRNYDYAAWTSPIVKPGFALTELITHWNSDTPVGTWVEVQMQGKTAMGNWTKWFVMGRWTSGDDFTKDIHRTSLDGQKDADGTVYTDTFSAADGHEVKAYRLKVMLFRPSDSGVTPTLRTLGAVSSLMPDDSPPLKASPVGRGAGRVLDVPMYSQEIHRGEYPEYDNGGEAWCSATSSAMVTDYWRAGPTAAETSWVKAAGDPQVDYTARYVFDYEYDGCGNWPFNCAYAASRGLRTFVTRLRSMTEAEEFIRAGIPLITSLSFEKEELDGAGYGTNGHLMVLCGFTRAGDPIMNDPASHLIKSDASVRTSYDRGQFENAWLTHTGGTVYVYTPQGYKLPAVLDRSEPNW